MRVRGKQKSRTRIRHYFARRPFMIDAEDFDFMDDCEMYDWMHGNPSAEPGPASS